MHRLLAMRVGGKYLIIPKLVGAFLVVISVLMVVSTTVDVVGTWEKIKDVRSCVWAADSTGDVGAYTVCVLKGIQTDVYVYGNGGVTDDEIWRVLTTKVSWWLFWILMLVLSIVIFRTGKFVFPVEEEEVERIRLVETAEETKETKKETKQEKKKSTGTRKRRRTTRKK